MRTLIVTLMILLFYANSMILSQIPEKRQTRKEFLTASFYSSKFKNKKTASGDLYDPSLHTSASRTFPFNTILYLKNPRTKQTTCVQINDRGPWIKGRDLDLSFIAAKELGMINSGILKVEIDSIQYP